MWWQSKQWRLFTFGHTRSRETDREGPGDHGQDTLQRQASSGLHLIKDHPWTSPPPLTRVPWAEDQSHFIKNDLQVCFSKRRFWSKCLLVSGSMRKKIATWNKECVLMDVIFMELVIAVGNWGSIPSEKFRNTKHTLQPYPTQKMIIQKTILNCCSSLAQMG